MGWIKTAEIYCLTLLEATSANSRCQQAGLPLKPGGENPSWPLLTSGGCSHSLGVLDLQLQVFNLYLCCHLVFSLRVSVSHDILFLVSLCHILLGQCPTSLLIKTPMILE